MGPPCFPGSSVPEFSPLPAPAPPPAAPPAPAAAPAPAVRHQLQLVLDPEELLRLARGVALLRLGLKTECYVTQGRGITMRDMRYEVEIMQNAEFLVGSV